MYTSHYHIHRSLLHYNGKLSVPDDGNKHR